MPLTKNEFPTCSSTTPHSEHFKQDLCQYLSNASRNCTSLISVLQPEQYLMKFILEAFIVMRLMNISICSINTQERDLFSLILRNETSRAYRMEIPYKAQTNVTTMIVAIDLLRRVTHLCVFLSFLSFCFDFG